MGRKLAVDLWHEATQKWDLPNRGPGIPLLVGTNQLQDTPDFCKKNLYQPILGLPQGPPDTPCNAANTVDIAGGAASNNIFAPYWMAPAI